MFGAIAGDLIGSPYETPATAIKTEVFPLFCDASRFTDDTVMTVAVAQALMVADGDEHKSAEAMVEAMRTWGRLYPHAGYGAMFGRWLRDDDPQPYGSYGNGSAMRVGPVGWFFPTVELTERWAEISARVTHNHPEGVRGAQATASSVFLARRGETKEQIKAYVEERFGYDLSRGLDEIRPGYRYVATCQETVPEAITAFLEADGFEDAVRKAVSLGGDSDTLGAIAGAIAEAYFGIPEEIRQEAIARLPEGLATTATAFWTAVDPRGRFNSAP